MLKIYCKTHYAFWTGIKLQLLVINLQFFAINFPLADRENFTHDVVQSFPCTKEIKSRAIQFSISIMKISDQNLAVSVPSKDRLKCATEKLLSNAKCTHREINVIISSHNVTLVFTFSSLPLLTLQRMSQQSWKTFHKIFTVALTFLQRQLKCIKKVELSRLQGKFSRFAWLFCHYLMSRRDKMVAQGLFRYGNVVKFEPAYKKFEFFVRHH